MGVLSKADLLKVGGPLPATDVPCPELGDGAVVRLRMLSAAERDQLERALYGDGGEAKAENIRATLVAACFTTDAGDVAFSPAEVEALGRQRGDVVDRLFDAARTLNKMNAKDKAAEKNDSAGEGAQPAGSSFASPSPLGVPTPTNLPADR